MSDEPKLPPHLLQASIAIFRQSGQRLAIPVQGFSMLPTLRPDDEVIVTGLDDGLPQVGDVIVFRSGDGLITHRVLRTLETADGVRLLAKGDNNWHADPPVAPDDVLGRVVARRRAGRETAVDGGYWRQLNRLTAALMWVQWRSYEQARRRTPRALRQPLRRAARITRRVLRPLLALLQGRGR